MRYSPPVTQTRPESMTAQPRHVVVTGTSTGIGLATVEALVERNLGVFPSVRAAADAERLKQRFGDRVDPVLLDVTDRESIETAARYVDGKLNGNTLYGLVNNAGIAVGGPLLHQPVDDFRRQMDINLTGVLETVQVFAPLLGADPARKGSPGRIVNVSSVAGKLASPFLGGYAASKHGLEALSGALRRELMLHGIDVIIVAPGAVSTPIWDKADSADQEPYLGTPYSDIVKRFQRYMVDRGREGMPAAEIANVISTALTAPRPKHRYAPVKGKFANWTLPRLLPARTLDRLIGKRLGLRR